MLFFLVRGCAFMPWNRREKALRVRLTVTRDFGTMVLKDARVEVRNGESAMRALEGVAEVETAYGGGFIEGIDGLRSRYRGGLQEGEKVDWFFYVNGQMADVGAGAYTVHEDDWLVFDYHPWDYSMFTAFLAGCYPDPFLRGYGGDASGKVVVLHAPARVEEAEEVACCLQQEQVSCVLMPLEEDWMPREEEYAIVVGLWEDLRKNNYLRECMRNASRAGLFALFEGDALQILDARGNLARSLPANAGLVQGTGARLGDGRSALLVAGLDEAGLREAVSSLAGWRTQDGRPVLAWTTVAGEGCVPVPGGSR